MSENNNFLVGRQASHTSTSHDHAEVKKPSPLLPINQNNNQAIVETPCSNVDCNWHKATPLHPCQPMSYWVARGFAMIGLQILTFYFLSRFRLFQK